MKDATGVVAHYSQARVAAARIRLPTAGARPRPLSILCLAYYPSLCSTISIHFSSSRIRLSLFARTTCATHKAFPICRSRGKPVRVKSRNERTMVAMASSPATHAWRFGAAPLLESRVSRSSCLELLLHLQPRPSSSWQNCKCQHASERNLERELVPYRGFSATFRNSVEDSVHVTGRMCHPNRYLSQTHLHVGRATLRLRGYTATQNDLVACCERKVGT